MEFYAAKHDMDFRFDEINPVERPASWYKIPLMKEYLRTYDRVLWIDVDVVIIDGRKNILDDLGEGIHGMVVHNTSEGQIPNMGVWITTPEVVPYLEQAWEQHDLIHHAWWEQAAMLRLMGFKIQSPGVGRIKSTVLWDKTSVLPNQWNHHPFSPVDNPYFKHWTPFSFEHRMSGMRQDVKVSNLC